MRILSPTCLLSLAATAVAQGAPQVLAATGDAFPAIPGAIVRNLQIPTIDFDGDVLWRTDLVHDGNLGIGAHNDQVLCFGRGLHDYVVVARTGSAEPTGTMPGLVLGPTMTQESLLAPTGNIVLFGAELSGPGIVSTSTPGQPANDQALFWGPPGALQVLVRRGDPVPNRPGLHVEEYLSYFSVSDGTLAPNGNVVFEAYAFDPALNWVLCMMAGTPGNLTTVIAEGDPVVVGAATHVVASFGAPIQTNAAGQAMFDLNLSTTAGSPPATFQDDLVIMLHNPGVGLEVVAREGQLAPGTAGCTFADFLITDTAISANGTWLLQATLTGGDAVLGVNDEAWYRRDAQGNLQLLYRSGSQLADGSAPDWFARGTSLLRDDGELWVTAHLVGPNVTPANEWALLRCRQGQASVVLRTGDPNPTAPSLTMTDVNYSLQPTQLGQVFLEAGNEDANHQYVQTTMVIDPLRGPRGIVAKGDVVQTSTGPQTVLGGDSVFVPNGEGASFGTNAHGRMARLLYLTNGAAIATIDTSSLHGSGPTIPATGGQQTLTFQGVPALAGSWYLVVGSLSGSRPATPFAGITVPLVYDFWTPLSQQNANTTVYQNTFGQLDAAGNSSAAFVLPPNATFLQGVTFTHAQVIIAPNGLLLGSSQPVPVQIL